MKRCKAGRLVFVMLGLFLVSCLGAGRAVRQEQALAPLPYDRAFDLALQSAREMSEECRQVNPFNYPAVVSLGTSQKRGVITVHYRFDPEAGSVCTEPPGGASAFLKRAFVPHFGAEFYMHVRFVREGDRALGVQVEVSQSKGVKKAVFDEEMERLRELYLRFLRRHWR
ncbi:MAG: hypothetical protein AB1751_01575 [Acidobacteriota bacterium]